MKRRDFLGHSLAGGAFLGGGAAAGGRRQASATEKADDDMTRNADVHVERRADGKPHAGKVLATIAPHSDDHSILCGGTVAKLIEEGYTGYLIRTSNDEKDSYDMTIGETVLANEVDTREMAKVLGIEQVFDLNYRNHFMDDVSRVELRARLIFLFRLLKVDTIFSYDPWGHYEENPDHYVTAQCVEAACWMAEGHLDFPEHRAAGIEPHGVSERYYYARGPQLVNRVVDISSTIEKKMAAIRANKTMIGHMVGSYRDQLSKRKHQTPGTRRRRGRRDPRLRGSALPGAERRDRQTARTPTTPRRTTISAPIRRWMCMSKNMASRKGNRVPLHDLPGPDDQ